MIGSDRSCLRCPANCECSILHGIVSKADFYLSFDANGRALASKCAPNRCYAGSTCGPGRVAYSVHNTLCSQCLPGLSDVGGHCVKCHTEGGIIFLLLLLGLVLVRILHGLSTSQRISGHVKILMYFIQVGPLLSFAPSNPMFTALRWISLDFFTSGSTCLIDVSEISRLMLGFAPQALGFCLLCVLMGLDYAVHRWRLHRQAANAAATIVDSTDADMKAPDGSAEAESPFSVMTYAPTVIAIYLFTINTTAQTIFAFLNCQSVYVDQRLRRYVFEYPQIDCDSAAYRSLLPLVIFMLVLEFALIPLLLFATMTYVRSKSASKSHGVETDSPHRLMRTFRVLFAPFVARFYYWEFVIIVRRAVLVAVTAFLFSNDVRRLTVSSMFCLLFLCLQLTLRPFASMQENVMESVSLVLLQLLTLILLTMQYPLSDNDQTGVGVYLLIPAIFMIAWVCHAKRSGLHKFYVTSTRNLGSGWSSLRRLLSNRAPHSETSHEMHASPAAGLYAPLLSQSDSVRGLEAVHPLDSRGLQ